MSGVALLLVQREDQLWGVDRATVRSVTRDGSSVVVRLAGGQLRGDEIATPPGLLAVHAAGAVSRAFLVEGVSGLALFEGRPVLIVDGNHLPRTPWCAPVKGDEDVGG